MSVDLVKNPDYSTLIEKLIEKTQSGKLNWTETAEEDSYLAAVKGVQTFEIRSDWRQHDFQLVGRPIVTLTVRGTDGKILYQHEESEKDSRVFELFRLAQRIVTRVDERIESSLELLDKL